MNIPPAPRPAPRPAPARSDWQRFHDLLEANPRIKPAAHPHYARWAAAWQKAVGDIPTAEATRRFFDDLGRHTSLADWQFRQAVRAVELWCREIRFHPRTGRIARYHLHENSLQRQFKEAVRKAQIPKRATCHTLRHSFASHLLESGVDK